VRGDRVCAGFGAGLTWAATAIRWSLPLPVTEPPRRVSWWHWLRYRWARLRSQWRRVWRRVDAHVFHVLYDRDGVRKQKKR